MQAIDRAIDPDRARTSAHGQALDKITLSSAAVSATVKIVKCDVPRHCDRNVISLARADRAVGHRIAVIGTPPIFDLDHTLANLGSGRQYSAKVADARRSQ